VVVLAGITSVPHVAEAAGFFLPGRGVEPLGRAGAYTAAGEGDLDSLWYNPANLALLDQRQLTVDFSLIGTFQRFHRASRQTQDGRTKDYDPVSNQALPPPIPQALYGDTTGIDGLTWAVGLYAPYAATVRYPQEGAQRYSLVDSSGAAVGLLHGALAYQINDWLRIGGGIQNWFSRFILTRVVSGYTGLHGRPEDRDLDILTKLNVTDLFVPSGNIGITARVAKFGGGRLLTAASLQLPAKFRDKNAKITYRKPSHPAYDGAYLSNDSADAGFVMPLIARFGTRYAKQSWDIELDVVYEHWDSLNEFRVDPNNIVVKNIQGVGSLPVGPVNVPQYWRDAFSVRLGHSYQWSEKWSTRAGYTFETGAVPKERYSVFRPDGYKHMFAFGAGYKWNDKWLLDASAAFYAVEDVTVTNSKQNQTNPSDSDGDVTIPVGNGTYNTDHLSVGVGLTHKF
jgi:long-chain fatty acid transport protein